MSVGGGYLIRSGQYADRIERFPRTAALRWFAAAYLLVLGISFLILPRGPINPLNGLIWLRGPLFILSGLTLLWLCTLRLSRRAATVLHVLVAIPPAAVAAQYVFLHAYPPAITLVLLSLGIALSSLALPTPPPSAWRPDALGLVLGLALAAQGIDLLARPQPNVIPYGLYHEMAVIFVVFGVAIVCSQLLTRTPPLLRRAAHVGGGASLLALWILLAVGVSPVYWVLNASVVLAGAATIAVPWVSPRWVPVVVNTVRSRVALGLFTGSLVPLLIAVPFVLAHRGMTEPVAVSTRQTAFGVTLLLSLSAAVGGWWLARRLIVPLSRLVAGVERIAAGARPVALVYGGPAEIEELGAAVQSMAAKLDAQVQKVEEGLDQHRAIAERLQSALQVNTGVFPGVEFAHVYESATELAKIGGDFFDVLRISDGRIGLLMGDVSGKGLDAAAEAVLVRNSLRAFTYYTDSPAAALAHANSLLMDFRKGGFVTAFFGILDPQSGQLTYCSAGHPPAILVGPSSVSLLDAVSPALGVFRDARFQEVTLRLNRGETLVLYTDGLTEARRDGHCYGESRLVEVLESLADLPPQELTRSLYAQALDFAGGRLADDLALLALRLQPGALADY
jgi:serine phosphatase RsbU (regulator of sigma subunit)